MKHSRAITLVELLVAVMIVMMVVAGVFSADVALRRMSDTGATDAQLEMQTRALAEMIRGDVKKVHGDLLPGNSGILVDSAARETLCFRYDVQVSGQYTPADYADDKWACYTKLGTKVYRCDGLDDVGVCTAADTQVGTLVSDQFDLMAIPSPELVADPATGEYYFQMTLINRLDPSAGTAHDGNILTAGTPENPQIVVTVRESPAGF